MMVRERETGVEDEERRKIDEVGATGGPTRGLCGPWRGLESWNRDR